MINENTGAYMHIEKQAYRIPEFCFAFGVKKSLVYEEFKEGRLKFFKVGRITLISKKAALEWLELNEALNNFNASERPAVTDRRL